MEKKQYSRGSLFIPQGYLCSQCYFLQTGIIEELKENQLIHQYLNNDYVLLDHLFTDEPTTSVFYVRQACSGYWVSKSEIIEQANQYLTILAKQIIKEKAHNELLQINDPIIKMSRYLYYEFEARKLYTFYLTITIENLCQSLSISHQHFLEALSFLENKKIISRKNKLINLLNLPKLKFYAFSSY